MVRNGDDALQVGARRLARRFFFVSTARNIVLYGEGRGMAMRKDARWEMAPQNMLFQRANGTQLLN
jgi:hypothetical protein